jgi:hypothetical protein
VASSISPAGTMPFSAQAASTSASSALASALAAVVADVSGGGDEAGAPHANKNPTPTDR